VLQHLANGMYGAIVVDPAEAFAPAKEYVLVQSEFYLTQAADGKWEGDLSRMQAVQPDFVVFNGAANQYQQQPRSTSSARSSTASMPMAIPRTSCAASRPGPSRPAAARRSS
jgi:hypothetical protein